MRKLTFAAALAASLVPTAAYADPVRELLGFHRCYFEIAARPALRNETKLVMVSPGYWETTLRPDAYAPLPGSAAFYHRRGWPTPTGPRAERTSRVWHEPIYMKVREPVVTDPGHAILLRAENCWPNR